MAPFHVNNDHVILWIQEKESQKAITEYEKSSGDMSRGK